MIWPLWVLPQRPLHPPVLVNTLVFPIGYWVKMSYAFTFMWLQMLDLIKKKNLQQKCGYESGMCTCVLVCV